MGKGVPALLPQGVFYHCDTTRRLNDRYGDMQHRIQVSAVTRGLG
jgi:hypothetical protein